MPIFFVCKKLYKYLLLIDKDDNELLYLSVIKITYILEAN